MSHSQAQQSHSIEIFSARQALVRLKEKLVLSSLTKQPVTLSDVEARMLLALTDERTPWSL